MMLGWWRVEHRTIDDSHIASFYGRMNPRMRPLLLLSLALLVVTSAFRPASSSRRVSSVSTTTTNTPDYPLGWARSAIPTTALWSKLDDMLPDADDDDSTVVILTGSEGAEFPEEMMKDIEEGKPSEWMVMQQLMGINIFTYALAAAIVVFLSLNFVLGPGWLGNAIGMQGTGTFNEVSDSLPDTLDLSDPNFRL